MWRPQDLILLFEVPMGMRKNIFKIYKNLGKRPRKDSPTLVYKVLAVNITVLGYVLTLSLGSF
jgi:hypothetical protein